MATPSSHQYTPLPPPVVEAVKAMLVPEEQMQEILAKYPLVETRDGDKDGDTEVIEGETFTHHFILGPGDGDVVRWHYVEAGPSTGEVVVFLHGMPDSWYLWHMQMAGLAKAYRCIAPDLKGYGQSEKGPGDYTHQGVAEQLFEMLKLIGVERFNLVAHDRGTIPADFIAANHPENVLRYARGDSHLFHYNPALSPHGEIFMNAAYNGALNDPRLVVLRAHASLCAREIPHEKVVRTIQEFAYPGISKAVPRYFNSSSFRAEWLERRNRLLAAWKCSLLLVSGYESKTQPREFFEGITKEHIPNAKNVEVRFLPGGHFWSLESPEETTELLRKFLTS
ncbi:hypothetical protein H2200_012591 [Cladophialophora chaetospira]|uniref:AB hydrolase-1 domain-containing protein n=1 Tax=Cladophialophora chaetospira TaxID=386627 RepID=A0AA39CC49_9EURO|nr:hypothetical protein H2200_012591 [Cladophialophora chaetospira]